MMNSEREREKLRVRSRSYHPSPAADCQSFALIMNAGVYTRTKYTQIHTSSVQIVSIRDRQYGKLLIPNFLYLGVFSS